MAMETSDLIALKEMLGSEHNGLSPYEDAMISYRQSKHANSTTVASIALACTGVIAGVGAWVFGGLYANAKSAGNSALITAQSNHTMQIENMLAGQIAQNRATFENAKSAQDQINITTTQSGSQSTNVTQSALASAEANVLTQSLLGNLSQNPTEVVLTSKQYCPCPASNGCCNG